VTTLWAEYGHSFLLKMPAIMQDIDAVASILFPLF
jgi:hypothetical protein